jgi:hypothetical protein
VINDDFFMALGVVLQGRRIVYAPRARSYERVSLTAGDEIARRSRIVAGRYQAMGMLLSGRMQRSLGASATLWSRPLVVWQVLSHKFMRPLVPFWMLLALLANLAAVVFPATGGGWLGLAFPFNRVFLALQAGFYLLAWVGNHFAAESTSRFGKRLGKILYLPSFLVNSNLAALLGLIRYLTGKQVAVWQRVARRETD